MRVYLPVVDQVEFFVMVRHEEVQHEVDRKQKVEEYSHDHPIEIVGLREGDPGRRNNAHAEQREDSREVPQLLDKDFNI